MHRVQATTRSTFQVKNLSAQFTPAGGNIHLCALTDGVSKKQEDGEEAQCSTPEALCVQT